MLPKKHRLPGAALPRTGSLITGPLFKVRSTPNSRSYNRFAIVISKKVNRQAVKRHYIKRRIAERVRTWPSLQRDILIIVSPRLTQRVPQSDIHAALDDALQKMKTTL